MIPLRIVPVALMLSTSAWATPPEASDTDMGGVVRDLVQEIGDTVETVAREVDRELAEAEREARAEGDLDTVEDIREGRESIIEVARELREEVEELRAELSTLKDEKRIEIRAEVQIDPDELAQRSVGSIRAYSDDVVVGRDQVVDDVEAMSGDIEVLGVVRHDAKTFSGDVIVREGGRILGNASTLSGDVIVEPGGFIEGVAHALSGDVVVEPGGAMSGIRRIHHEVPHEGGWGIASFLGGLYRRFVFLLAFAGAGVLLIALFPDRVRRVAEVLEEKPAQAGLQGLGWTLGIMLASVLFFWTILGPVFGMAVLAVAWMLGFVGLCQMLGDRLPFSYKPHGRWLAFLVGSLLMSFLSALPWVGVLTLIAASLFGIGAVFVSRFGSQ